MSFAQFEHQGGIVEISLSKDEVEILYQEGEYQKVDDNKRLIKLKIEVE